MAMPAKQKTWTVSANNRIPFVTLNDTMSKYLFGVKEFLKTNGYTIAGSSNGTTGGTPGTPDGVDRWITSANVTTQGANAASAQSWVILTDGNGVQILLTYQGAAAQNARFSFSPGALFVVAATSQNQPTATDEQVFSPATNDVINSTGSLDRSWFGWVDSQSKLCRFAIARNQVFVGQLWGVELVASVVAGAGTTWSPAVWGFALPANSDTWAGGSVVGLARPTVSSSSVNVSAKWAVEQFGNSSTDTSIHNSKAEMQGALGFPVVPIGIGSTTAGGQGKLGNLYDFWYGRGSGGSDGDVYQNKQYVGVAGFRGNTGSLIWPWDGATTPVLY